MKPRPEYIPPFVSGLSSWSLSNRSSNHPAVAGAGDARATVEAMKAAMRVERCMVDLLGVGVIVESLMLLGLGYDGCGVGDQVQKRISSATTLI